MKLTETPVTLFHPSRKQAQTLCRTAFPPEEQMPFGLLFLKALRKNTHFTAYYDENVFAGISYCIDLEDVVYVLYLAVNDQVRSKGYGSAILASIKERFGNKTLMLEIETLSQPEADNFEQRQSRLAFYERNGFEQTHLRENDNGVIYDILKCGRNITVQDMEAAHRNLSSGFHIPKFYEVE